MDAREYLETVRAAQRGIDRRLAVIESMQAREQVRAQRYDAVGKGAHGTDFMRSTDDRIDYERRSGAELSELRREVERGRELCAGVRSANPGKRWGDVLELRCELTRQVGSVGFGKAEARVNGKLAAQGELPFAVAPPGAP